MGRRGPQPEPTALRVLKDNPGKRPLPKEPKPVGKAPTMPGGMGPAARALWQRLAPELESMGCLTAVDREMLQIYCETWQSYRDALSEFASWKRASKKKGSSYSTPNGTLAVHPALKLVKEARTELRMLAHEFGLSPAARAGLHVEGGEPEGEDDTLD